VVDTDYQALTGPAGEGSDGDPWPATKLNDPVGRLDTEEFHRPATALDVRRAATHDPADHVPAWAGWVVKLSNSAVEKTLPHAHEASKRLRVHSKSMPLAKGARESDPPRLLSIGELAERTGLATTALRYYDDLGLVRPVTRASGQRRYAESAIRDVGVILFLREVGFSLAEIGSLVAGGDRRAWQEILDRKLSELDEQQHRLNLARTALEHGRRCPAGEPVRCSRFWSIIDGQMRGLSLEESHARAH
jgi:DNA-binding transcriptional MerR regulator